MMDIYYLNNNGAKLYLDRQPYKMLSATSLFDYEWEYEKAIGRNISKKDFDIVVSGQDKTDYYNNLKNLLECTEADIVSETAGCLYVGDYYILCYFIKSKKPSKYINISQSVLSFSIMPKSAWIKEIPISMRWQDLPEDTSGFDYPYGYSIDYAQGAGCNSNISTDSFGDMDFVITIYGYANNPAISIGANTYRINYTIQTGERVIIDSRNQTIVLIKTNGVVINLFRYRDSKYYIFEKITPGEQPVYWNSSFDFDIILFEERSEPRWM